MTPGPDRRSEEWKGQLLYKPWCDACGSDEWTRFVSDLSPYDYAGVTIHGRCGRCDGGVLFEPLEFYRACEPQRLRDRLAELQREAHERPHEFQRHGAEDGCLR